MTDRTFRDPFEGASLARITAIVPQLDEIIDTRAWSSRG